MQKVVPGVLFLQKQCKIQLFTQKQKAAPVWVNSAAFAGYCSN